jgi:hypothetical protein
VAWRHYREATPDERQDDQRREAGDRPSDAVNAGRSEPRPTSSNAASATAGTSARATLATHPSFRYADVDDRSGTAATASVEADAGHR